MRTRFGTSVLVAGGLLAGATMAAAQEGCPSGRAPYGSLGIGLYQCPGGSCSINMRDLKEGEPGPMRHSFSTEPRLRDIGPPGSSVLRDGDVLVAVDGRLITSVEGGARLGGLRPGEDVRLTIRRDGRQIDAWLTAERSCRYAGLEVGRGVGLPGSGLTYTTAVRPAVRLDSIHGVTLSNDTLWTRYSLQEADRVWSVYTDSLAPDSLRWGPLTFPEATVSSELAWADQAVTFAEPALSPFGLFSTATRPQVEFGVAISCGECGWRRSGSRVRFVTGEFPVVDAVEAGGPAAQAGLAVGDVLISIDGYPIPSDEGGRRLGALEAGERVTLEVRRGDRILEVSIAPREASGTRLRM
jgi:S1-C subfamily serine protease